MFKIMEEGELEPAKPMPLEEQKKCYETNFSTNCIGCEHNKLCFKWQDEYLEKNPIKPEDTKVIYHTDKKPVAAS